MDCVLTTKFSLDIVTHELTAALKHLIKAERNERVLLLRHQPGNLTISLGKASREVGAAGSWLQPVSVTRRWAKALAESPNTAAITTIRFDGQKLWARDLAVPCALEADAEANEELVRREESVDAVCQILSIYNVTGEDVNILIDNGDPSKAQLWGAGDGALVDHVAEAWIELATGGVRTSDIRKLFNHKMRGLFSRPKRIEPGFGTFARYQVSTEEKNILIQSGSTVEGKLWESLSHGVVRDAAAAWKRLAFYGVEPLQILAVMRRRPE